MSRTSADAQHLGRQLDALTTQVKRIADALTTPVATDDDAPTTTAGRPVVGIDPGTEPAMVVAQWIPEPPGAAEHRAKVADWLAAGTRDLSIPEQHPTGGYPDEPYPDAARRRAGLPPYPAADEDAERTARRDTLGLLLGRAERGALVTAAEGALLRQHVETEMREADTARATIERMKRTNRMVNGGARESRERAERGQVATERVRDARDRIARLEYDAIGAAADAYREALNRLDAALDGTEQPSPAATEPAFVDAIDKFIRIEGPTITVTDHEITIEGLRIEHPARLTVHAGRRRLNLRHNALYMGAIDPCRDETCACHQTREQ